MANCTNCSEKCPQAEMAHQIALGRMYATKELVELIKKIEKGELVEVVRYKDCEHKGWIQEPCHGKSVDFCNVFDSTINNPEKCFCYYGERRKNEAD